MTEREPPTYADLDYDCRVRGDESADHVAPLWYAAAALFSIAEGVAVLGGIEAARHGGGTVVLDLAAGLIRRAAALPPREAEG